MVSYVYFYNAERLHGSLSNVSPDQFDILRLERKFESDVAHYCCHDL